MAGNDELAFDEKLFDLSLDNDDFGMTDISDIVCRCRHILGITILHLHHHGRCILIRGYHFQFSAFDKIGDPVGKRVLVQSGFGTDGIDQADHLDGLPRVSYCPHYFQYMPTVF
jgi:hypothetical protein